MNDLYGCQFSLSTLGSLEAVFGLIGAADNVFSRDDMIDEGESVDCMVRAVFAESLRQPCQNPILIFRLVHRQPSAQRLTQILGNRLRSDHAAISVYEVLDLKHEESFEDDSTGLAGTCTAHMTMQLQRVKAFFFATVLHAGKSCLRKSLVNCVEKNAYTYRMTLCANVPSVLHDNVNAFVTKIIRMDAFPGPFKVLYVLPKHDHLKGALDWLVQKEFVITLSASTFQLTAQCMQYIQHCRDFTDSSLVLKGWVRSSRCMIGRFGS